MAAATSSAVGMEGAIPLDPQIEQGALEVAEKAKTVKIANQQEFEHAVAVGKEVARRIDVVTEFFAPLKAAAHEAHKRICEREKSILQPLENARKTLAGEAARWQNEQETLRLAEENRLREEARKADEDRRLNEAAQLEREGRSEEAVQVLEQESVSLPVVAPSTVTKVAGFTAKKKYVPVVTNMKDLVKAVAEGKVPIQALNANQIFLNAQARAFGKALNYPGVVLREDSSGSFRRG